MEHKLDNGSKNSKGLNLYPKLVYPNGPSGEPVRVLNIKHEQEVLGIKEEINQPELKQQDENKKEEKKEIKNSNSWS